MRSNLIFITRVEPSLIIPKLSEAQTLINLYTPLPFLKLRTTEYRIHNLGEAEPIHVKFGWGSCLTQPIRSAAYGPGHVKIYTRKRFQSGLRGILGKSLQTSSAKDRKHDVSLISTSEMDAQEYCVQFCASRKFLRPCVQMLQFLRKTCKNPVFSLKSILFRLIKIPKWPRHVFDLADHRGNVYFAIYKKNYFFDCPNGLILGCFRPILSWIMFRFRTGDLI